MPAEYTVEVGKNKSAYKVKYRFATAFQAYWWYNGILVHSGRKKRLRCEGEVLEREITQRY